MVRSNDRAKSSQPIILETDRPGLILVEMTTPEEDAEYFDFQSKNQAHIAEFGNIIYGSTTEIAVQRAKPGVVSFGIRNDDMLVGESGYVARKDGQEAEVGIVLAKDATGKGYATAVIKALTAHLLPIANRIFAEIEPTNVASINLMERAGYIRIEGLVERDWGRAAVFEYMK